MSIPSVKQGGADYDSGGDNGGILLYDKKAPFNNRVTEPGSLVGIAIA
jgi:hypothetical protein